jgi:hypothetical protein
MWNSVTLKFLMSQWRFMHEATLLPWEEVALDLMIGPWTVTIGQESYVFYAFLMLFTFETKQQVTWACNLNTCGYLATHNHFPVFTIVVLNLWVLISNKYSSTYFGIKDVPTSVHNPQVNAV